MTNLSIFDGHTPGDWAWVDWGGWHLVGTHGMRPIVMDFVRKGMQGATPRLRDKSDLMVDFDPYHPDSRLIVSAPALLAKVQELESVLRQIANDPISFDNTHGTHDATRWRKCQELAREALLDE